MTGLQAADRERTVWDRTLADYRRLIRCVIGFTSRGCLLGGLSADFTPAARINGATEAQRGPPQPLKFDGLRSDSPLEISADTSASSTRQNQQGRNK